MITPSFETDGSESSSLSESDEGDYFGSIH